jgi:hypothetical protein
VLGLAYENEDIIRRIYILFGAIGIIHVARWFARALWPEEWKALELD